MTQPLCSKLKKWINQGSNTKNCCQNFRIIPYRQINFQSVLRRYETNTDMPIHAKKRSTISLGKQEKLLNNPTKKIKPNQQIKKIQNKKNSIKSEKLNEMYSYLSNQRKFPQNITNQLNQQKTGSFKINLNKKIKTLKSMSQIVEKDISLNLNNHQQQQLPLLDKGQNENVEIAYKMEEQNLQISNINIMLNQNQVLKEIKEFNNQKNDIVEEQQAECQNFKEYQINQSQNLIQEKVQKYINQKESQKIQLRMNQTCKIQEYQEIIEEQELKSQKYQFKINVENLPLMEGKINDSSQQDSINQMQKKLQTQDRQREILSLRAQTLKKQYFRSIQNDQNSFNLLNINFQSTNQKINLKKQEEIQGKAIINHKKHHLIKDKVIITRAQQSNLLLLNKLSLRLLRQKYGQQETIDSLTLKILQNEKSYHIQGILGTKNRIISQLTHSQKQSILKKYLKEQEENFKIHIR